MKKAAAELIRIGGRGIGGRRKRRWGRRGLSIMWLIVESLPGFDLLQRPSKGRLTWTMSTNNGAAPFPWHCAGHVDCLRIRASRSSENLITSTIRFRRHHLLYAGRFNSFILSTRRSWLSGGACARKGTPLSRHCYLDEDRLFEANSRRVVATTIE